MRRTLLLSALFVAATLLACDEDPIAPPMTGSISLRVIMGTEGQQQAAALHTTATAEGVNAAPVSSAHRAEFKMRRSEFDTESAPAVRIEPAQPGQVPTLSVPSAQPAAAPAAPAAIDAATIHIIGPTNRTLPGQTPGSTVTIDGLTPGSYTVVLLGLVGGATGQLDYYGRTTVTVNAGSNSTATIAFTSFKPVVNNFTTPSTNVSFEVTFPAVAGADSYIVEFDTNTAFTTSFSGSVPTPFAVATVGDTGTYYVRARAVNDTYAPNGGSWGAPKTNRIVDDQDPSGADYTSAFDLGFGAAANAMLTELNILPEGDEDWFSVDLCLGDLISVETWAQRHAPPSGLDSYLELYNAMGLALVAENDDLHVDTLDSRLQATVGSSGTYYIRMFGPFQAPVGQYDLSVIVTEGSGHIGGTCSTLPGATNGWTGGGDGTSWSAPGNWLLGVPTPTDTVSVPTGANPTLSENVTIAGLIVAPGGHVETNGWDLTVTGNLAAGNSITGTGTVILTGTGVSLRGGLPNLYVSGDVSLEGQAYATGDVQVEGTLRMNGYQMAVGGTFSTINNSGLLEMTSDADTLAVAGLATFAGGSTAGRLTAGRLILTGGITAQSVYATFAPSGTHSVVLYGASNRTITDVIGVSFFNDLALQTTGTVTVAGVAGQAQINGQLISDASVTPTVTGGNLLAYGVAAQNMVLNNATLLIGNGAITALDGVVFQNFPAGTQQLIVNRDGGSYTFNNLRFSQANGASDVYIEARDANTGDGDPLTINLASASPADGSPGVTSEFDATVNWVVAPAGDPCCVSFTVQPSSVIAGIAISPAIQVTIQDAQTLTVDTSTANVTLAINDNPAGGTLSGTTTVAAVNGVATFSNLSINKAGVGYTLIAFSPGLATEVSGPFTVTAGTADSIALESGNNQTAAPNVQLPDSLAVKVLDVYGNGVAGVDVAWTVTQSDGALSAAVTATDSRGIATVAFTLGGTLGTNSVEAAVSGLSGSPVTFTATASNAVMWLNAASGNWSDGANWSGGSAPTASDAAVISVAGTYTVTIDTDVNVESITLGSGTSGPRVEANGQTITATGNVRVNINSVLDLTSSTLNAAAVVNEGSFQLDASTVNADIENRRDLHADGSTTLDGVFSSGTGSTLVMNGSGADVTLTSGFTNNGTVLFTSAEAAGYPSLYVDTGTLVNAAGSQIRFEGLGGGYLEADLDNRDSLKVMTAETVTLTGSTISNSGVMYAASADLNVDAALTNSGTINIADNRTLGSYGAGFGNTASGQVVMGANATLDLTNTTTTFATGYTVRGTRSIWIDGTSATGPSVTFAGNLVVETGGTFGIKNNTLTVDSLVNGGDFTLDVAQVVGPVNNIGSFTATVGGNSVTGNFYSATDAWMEVAEPGAELVVTGNLANHGTIKLSSTTAGTAPKLTVTGGTLTHYQWFDSDGPAGGLLVVDSLDNQGELHAVAGGIFVVQGPAINNDGTFVLTDADFTVSGSGLFVQNGGIVINNDHTFTRTGGTFENPGQIFGNGTVDVSATTFTSTGAIHPGASPGTLNFIGDVTLVSGDLNIELDGTTAGQYDVVNVSGQAALSGVLNVTQNYAPAVGDTFTVMTFGSSTGQFTSHSGLAIDATHTLSPVYGVTSLMLVVVDATDSVVVSPTSAALASVGATQQFTADAYGGGSLLTGKTFIWSSLNTNVATVDQAGLVTAVASGQTTIQAEVDGVKGYALVTVAVPGATPVNLWGTAASGLAFDIRGIWGTSASEVYAVSTTTDIIRYDGTNWNSFATGLSTGHDEIWGTSSTDIFALGPNGQMRHYDGTIWQQTTAPTSSNNLAGVWGSSPADVMAVGWGGSIVHFDGNSWASMASGTAEVLFDVWAASSSDYFAVGVGGTVLQSDGVSWSSMASNTSQDLLGIWGTAANDVFAVGGSGTVLHYDGAAWSAFSPAPATTANLRAVWGSSASDLYVLGLETTDRVVLHFDGTTWTSATVGTLTLFDVWGTEAGDVWASATGGTIYRGVRGATVAVTPVSPTITSIGGTAQLAATATDGGSNPITGVAFTWFSDDDNIATVDADGLVTAVGNGIVTIHATAPGGATSSTNVEVNEPVAEVIVAPAGATITGGTLQFSAGVFDGAGNPVVGATINWSILNSRVAGIDGSGLATGLESGQAIVEANVNGVTGYAVLTVAIPGATPVTAWGTATNPSTVNQLLGAWGTAADNIFMGGDVGTVVHYDGTSWTLMTTPNYTQVMDFWGVSASDIYAIGGGGSFHFNGTDWSNLTWPGGTAYAIWGSSPNDIWGVGSGGAIFHYDGTSWTTVTSPTSEDLFDMYGFAADDIYALGTTGTILHYDGTSWSTVTSGTTETMVGVWGTASDDVYFVGAGSTVLHWDGSTLSPMTLPAGHFFISVWGTSSSDIYLVGLSSSAFRYDGATWHEMSVPTTATNLRAIWGTATTDLYVPMIITGGGSHVRGVRGATVDITVPTSNLVGVDDQVQLTAEAQDGDGAAIPGVVFTWESDDELVATVDGTGLVTAVGQGTANISATVLGGAFNSTPITVQIPASVVVSPAGASARFGNTVPFTATLYDEASNPINNHGYSTTWGAVNPYIATVGSTTGIATGSGAGQTAVSATVNGIVGYGLFTVSVPNTTPVNVWTEVYDAPGQIWRLISTGNGDEAYATTTAPNNVLRYDGSNWVPVSVPSTGNFYGGWVGAPDDVFLTGDAGEILHYDGTSWGSQSAPNTNNPYWSAWGSAPNDIWAVSEPGMPIIHYDGTSWTDVPNPATGFLWDIWGSDSANVFAVGGSGGLFRYDGTNWSAETHPAPSRAVREVWGISDSRVFGTSYDTVLTYDGSSWSVLGSGFGSGQLYGIWGSDTDDIYVGSSGGTINHYNGTVWNTVSPPGSPGTIWSITGTGGGDVFAASGSGKIFRGVRGATVRYFNNGTEFAGSIPWNPNFLLGQAITIPYTVEMTDFGLITKGSTGSQAQMALYTDNGGEPGQLVVQSSIGAVNATGRIEYAVPQTRLDAGTYWLMAIYDAVTPIAMESSPIATPTKHTVITFGTALPTTFPVPNNETRGRLNYYIKGFAVPQP